MESYHFAMILLGWLLAGATPGPATLAISTTAMGHGRKAGLSIGAGVLLGSAILGFASAAGMSAIMVANAWLFEVVRYVGAAYLLYLAFKSLKSALNPVPLSAQTAPAKNFFLKGLLIHLTNPKAFFAWGSIYALILPSGAGYLAVFEIYLVLLAIAAVVFIGYGFLFSISAIATGYASLKRWFELAFAVLFGGASLKLLTAKIEV